VANETKPRPFATAWAGKVTHFCLASWDRLPTGGSAQARRGATAGAPRGSISVIGLLRGSVERPQIRQKGSDRSPDDGVPEGRHTAAEPALLEQVQVQSPTVREEPLIPSLVTGGLSGILAR
jgi:hypothetical protein